MTSRRQVATYLSDNLGAKRRLAVRSAAAWLVSHHRENQAGYLAADVAELLSERGYVYVRIVSARKLSAASLARVRQFLSGYGRQFEIETVIDPTLIGGIKVELPGSALDSSVTQALRNLVEIADAE